MGGLVPVIILYAPESVPLEVLSKVPTDIVSYTLNVRDLPVEITCNKYRRICFYSFIMCTGQEKRGGKTALIIGLIVKMGIKEGKRLSRQHNCGLTDHSKVSGSANSV